MYNLILITGKGMRIGTHASIVTCQQIIKNAALFAIGAIQAPMLLTDPLFNQGVTVHGKTRPEF